MIHKLLVLAFSTIVSTTAMAQAPAFPGAEGHGRYVTGGRGGEIRHVTNLNDDGTGSLRVALKGDEPKIIVFDVGGIIALKSQLRVRSNTTILGQTAPSPGITLRYQTVRPDRNNIIFRFLRFRLGEEAGTDDASDTFWGRQLTGIMIDHCSMSWSVDELSSFYDNNNMTMQWCMLGEALDDGHSKGEHSFGGIWGGKLASFHHNFLLHMKNRVPRFNGARYEWGGYTSNLCYTGYNWKTYVQAEMVDLRNCVMYNYEGGCYGGPGGGYINMVNNYFKAGPVRPDNNLVTNITVGSNDNSKGHPKAFGMTSRYYIKGNYMNTQTIKEEDYDWKGVDFDNGTFTIDGEQWSLDTLNLYGNGDTHKNNSAGKACIRIKMDKAITAGDITTHTAKDAYTEVLAFSGASLYRDTVDRRFVRETTEGTTTYVGSVHGYKGIIDKVADQGIYALASTSRPAGFDTDGDGMPNDWETAQGLNPDDASDGSTKTLDPQGYYTNIEVYANSIVEHIMKSENETGQSNFVEYYPVIAGGTQGIRTVENTPSAMDAPFYNLAGQRVNALDKCIMIKNGRKVISTINRER